MKSDKKKSFLVFLIFFALLGFCFYKNLESSLKGFYASRNYHGSVQITGFSWEGENDAPDVNKWQRNFHSFFEETCSI